MSPERKALHARAAAMPVHEVARVLRERDALLTRLGDNQSAWQDEEPSVQEEHAALIRANERMLERIK